MKRKRFAWICLLFFCLLCGGCRQTERKKESDYQKEISDQVLRFHIRAESDEKEDQELKLKVKNQVVSYLQNILSDCSSKESCKETIEKQIDQIEEIGNRVCRSEGSPVKVCAYLTREFFPLKEYGDMIFPSGVYDALRVDLGKAEGKNWWCMMYPSLCMVDGVVEKVPVGSKEKLKDNLSKEAYDSLLEKNQFSFDSESNYEKNESQNSKYHI